MGINQKVTVGRRLLGPVSAATVLAVTVTLASVPASATPRVEAGAPAVRAASGATTAATTATAAVQLVAERQRARRAFTPRTGVIHTDPRRSDRRKLLNHIMKSISSTRRRQRIRIISWNIASREFVNRLINAHQRGVSVRVLMSSGKAEGNSNFYQLRRALKKNRKGITIPRRYRSWARACNRSCRGRRGIAHSKLFIFSKVGRAERVVMSTSANATETAVQVQWNDLFTMVGNRPIYNGFVNAFAESARDRPVRHAYRVFGGQEVTGYVYPLRGKFANGDRVKKELRRITCRGARGQTGINGRTRIRIAQDAIINDRGIEIAKILRNKWENGCNIRIVYALMGKQVLGVLRNTTRGRGVPIQQIVNDWDDDGVYDRYLHSKVMAVSGRYRKDRSTRIAWQGSENWSGLATISDEQGFRIRRGGAEGMYARWVDHLFFNPPQTSQQSTLRLARARGVDPYALIKAEMGLPARQIGPTG